MSLGSTIDLSGLTQTFDDEFNTFSSSPDGSSGVWETAMDFGNRSLGSNGEQEYYSDSSVGYNPFSINNGTLDITAAPGTNPLNLPYNSGAITTEATFSQLYGYFEIRTELPAGQGLWPAFWLLPADHSWPPELDVFEVLGNNPGTLYFSTHSNDQPTQGTTLNVADTSQGFHTYGVMWGPQTVDMYIDGTEVASMPTPADMNKPMYMLANLAVGGYWPGDADSTTPFPATMKVDYVRAYAYPGTSGGTETVTDPSQNIGPAPVAPVVFIGGAVSDAVGATVSLPGVSFTANWPGGQFTAMVSDNTGHLFANAPSDVTETGQGTTSLTLVGSLAEVNLALASLSYQATAAGADYVWISANNPQGQQGVNSVVVTTTAGGSTGGSTGTGSSGTGSTGGTSGVSSSSGTPTVTTPSALSVATGASHALSGVSVAEANATGNFTVMVTDSTGKLHSTATSGVTEQGEGSTALTLVGSLSAVNAELATLTYQGAATGTDWLWVSANDANQAQGVSSVVVTVNATAAATPSVTAPSAVSLTAGTATAVKGLKIADSNTDGTFAATLTAGTSVLHAGLVDGVTATGQSSHSVTLSGSLAGINAALAGLTARATADGTDQIQVSVTDGHGAHGNGAAAITARWATPTVTAPAKLSSAAGATTAVSGVSVADATGGAYTVTVSDSTGKLHTAAVNGVKATGENTTSLTLAGQLAAINTELATLTYKAGAGGTDTLSVSASDVHGTTGAGATAVSVTAAAPVVTVPATLGATNGTAVKLAGVSFADAQSGGSFTVMVSDSTGLLHTTAVSGVTAGGENTNALTLTGGLGALNAELATLTYKGTVPGADWLWVSANDTAGGQGISPVVVTVGAASTLNMAQPMTAAAKTASATTADTSSTSVSTALNHAMLGLAGTAGFLTATLTDKADLLSTPPAASVTITGEGTTHLVLQGLLADITADLTTLTYARSGGITDATPADTLSLAVAGASGNILTTVDIPMPGLHLTP